MKKLISLTIIFLFALTLLHGQMSVRESRNETHVSSPLASSFGSDFGQVEGVEWTDNGSFNQADFVKDNKHISAFYDASGKLIGTSEIVNFKSLPVKGRMNIFKHYSSYAIGPVIFFDDPNHNDYDLRLYGTRFAEEKNYFVMLAKGPERIVLEVSPTGQLILFSKNS